MQKKSPISAVSAASSTGNARISGQQKEQALGMADYLRRLDMVDGLDFIAFMEYCSYVSANAAALGIYDFDAEYAIGEVRRNLGNKYLATDFVEYYAGLCSQNPELPDLRGISFHIHDLSEVISGWAVASLESFLPSSSRYTEDVDGSVAQSTWLYLADIYSSGIAGKDVSEYSSSMSIAELVVRLADVEGKSVLDFVCGNGVYLSTALALGATSICGRDINAQAVLRARILCFFANAAAPRDLVVSSVFSSANSASSVQRVIAAPPLGGRLRERDIQERGYCANVVKALVGENAVGTLEMEDFCVAKALASLTDDGVAVMHVSASFLFHQQKARQMLRRALVEGGYLQTVIELPGGCIPSTRVKSALLIIGKRPSDEGILIVDLDSKDLTDKGYVAKSRGRCEITDAGISWLAKMVEQRDEVPLVSTVVDRERILASGSNLCYATYGDVLDYGTILDETRSNEDILGDIRAAQASIDSLGEQIADILNSIEKKG